MALNAKIAPLYFILAPAYHGAGLLSSLVNQHQHILSLGTANPLRGEEQLCSCGESVKKFCPFWSKAASLMNMNDDDPFPTWMPQSPFLARNDRLNKWLNGVVSLIANEVSPKSWKMVYEQAERFFGTHDRFLTYCQDWAAHKVFVDAERSTLKFMVMASMEFPVRGVIHLVRDPRGYASALKKYYPESTAENLGLEWAASHTRIRRLAQVFPNIRFLTLKYEDLVDSQTESVEKAINFMKLKATPELLNIHDPRKNHLIGQGTPEQNSPYSWREMLNPDDQIRAVRAAGPLFAELGYKN